MLLFLLPNAYQTQSQAMRGQRCVRARLDLSMKCERWACMRVSFARLNVKKQLFVVAVGVVGPTTKIRAVHTHTHTHARWRIRVYYLHFCSGFSCAAYNSADGGTARCGTLNSGMHNLWGRARLPSLNWPRFAVMNAEVVAIRWEMRRKVGARGFGGNSKFCRANVIVWMEKFFCWASGVGADFRGKFMRTFAFKFGLHKMLSSYGRIEAFVRRKCKDFLGKFIHVNYEEN